MADLFKKIGDSFKTTFKEAAEQTQQSVDQTVYRTELISKKSDLKKAYQQLGLAKYEDYISGSQDTDYAPLYNKVASLKKEIEILEKKVRDIINSQKDSFDTYKREVRTTWNDKMASEPKPEKGPDGVEIMKICDRCNTGNHIEAAYCINCGHKF